MASEKHLYLVVRGKYGPADLSAERWQFGIRLAGVFGTVDDFGTLPNNWSPQAVTEERSLADGGVATNYLINGPAGSNFSPDDWLEDVASPAIAGFMASAYIHSNAEVEELRLYPIGAPDGKVVTTAAGASVARRWWTSNTPKGLGAGTPLPPQNTIVVSLRTNRGGRRGRGRFYPPVPPSSALNANGAFSAASVFSGKAADFLSDIASPAAGQDMRTDPIVTGAPWTTYGKVIRAEVGNRVDTQRRRRRQLSEVYNTADVP